MENEAQISAALQELLAEDVIRSRLVVSLASGEAILREIEQGQPTEALRGLFRDARASHGDW